MRTMRSEAMIEAVALDLSPQPAAREAPRLSLRSVTKTWNPQTGPVLNDVELTVHPGTLVAIVGRNGTGKTTLLRIAAGLIYPDRGVVELDGLRPKHERREYLRRLGFVSAGSLGLYARLSPRRHLDYWARLALLPRGERGEAVERALIRFELTEFASRRVDRISMGQRQRLRLAMAFLHAPRLLLLDEPYTSLDAEGRALLDDVLAEHRARHGSGVLCVPTGEATAPGCDVYALEEGRLVPR